MQSLPLSPGGRHEALDGDDQVGELYPARRLGELHTGSTGNLSSDIAATPGSLLLSLSSVFRKWAGLLITAMTVAVAGGGVKAGDENGARVVARKVAGGGGAEEILKCSVGRR